MASVALQLKVLAIGQLVKSITDENPIVKYGPDYAEITFTESQKKILQAWLSSQIDDQLKEGVPGDLRIDFNSILIPVAIKKLAPVMLASGGLGFVIGKLL
jgi:hypothetical protein